MIEYQFLVLGGAGIQGKIASSDLLSKGYGVCIADIFTEPANYIAEKYPGKCVLEKIDISDKEQLDNLFLKIKPKFVLNCAEGNWNLLIYNKCLEFCVSVIDLGSSIEITKSQIALDSSFKEKGIIGITGCGSTPGINNVMLRYAANFFDEIETIDVGFDWNSNKDIFVPPFSLESIFEEYVTPPVILKNGKFETIKPMSIIKKTRFKKIGTQESFVVIHPEVFTFFNTFKKKKVKNIYFYAGFPKHSSTIIKSLLQLDFANDKEKKVNENIIVPVRFISNYVQTLKSPEDYLEKEILWVNVFGKKNKKSVQKKMKCVVNTLDGWEKFGCNIDTGVIASLVAQMIYEGLISKPGSYAPEDIIEPELLFEAMRPYHMYVYDDGKIINKNHKEIKNEKFSFIDFKLSKNNI